MAEYVFAEIGLDWNLAFRFADVVRVYHSMDPMFGQVKHDSVSLPGMFGVDGEGVREKVAIVLNDGSCWLAVDSCLDRKGVDRKIFPLLPAFFGKGREWCGAVLLSGGRMSFVTDAAGLGRLRDG